MYDLIAHTEDYLQQAGFRGDTGTNWYPSEASVVDKTTGKVIGTCMRQAYLRAIRHPGLPKGPSSDTILKMGKWLELMMVDTWKSMGILVDQSVRFRNERVWLSGELDVVLREPGSNTLFGAEIKTFHGYKAETEIMGSKTIKAHPKDNHLLQTIIYANEFRNRLAYFKLFYLARDNGRRKQFNIAISPSTKQGEPTLASIDDEPITSFTVEDIYARYAKLTEAVKSCALPPAEFQLRYTDERIEADFANGLMSKKKYTDFHKKGEEARPGDWQCSYCPYKNFCYSSAPAPVAEEESGSETDL